jgi:hypothetical protein
MAPKRVPSTLSTHIRETVELLEHKTPAPRFLSLSAGGQASHSLTREQLTGRRASPTDAFQHCEKPSLLRGWGESLGMFRDWIFGKGSESRIFESCSLQSQNMADAPGVEKARQLMYQKNEGRPFEEWEPVKNYRGSFGLPGLVAAGIDPTEQFVGSYKVEIFPQPDKTLRFELSNTTSLKSFLYGQVEDHEREDFAYGGNMRQTYTWTEPVETP